VLDFGIKPQFHINGILSTVGPSNYGFTMSDSIYSVFPELELVLVDLSGLSLELGTFTRGLPLKIVLEIEDNILESEFIVNHRDNIGQQASNYIGGTLKIGGVHKSYTNGRESRSAYYNKKVSEIVKELFPDVDAEDTLGKVAVYQSDDSYGWVNGTLIDIAGSATKTPFLFFRDLAEKLVFRSAADLVSQSPVARLALTQTDGRETIADTMNAFMPFDKRLTDILDKLAGSGGYLDRLAYKTEDVTVADLVDDCISLISDPVKTSSLYFGRQYNPDMDYSDLRAALWTAQLRKGFFSDKAFTSVPFNGKLVSGKVVDIEVFLQDADSGPMISEAYSGKWLIEQSKHSWDGSKTMAHTSLVLSRSSYKPVSDSILLTDSYKGK